MPEPPVLTLSINLKPLPSSTFFLTLSAGSVGVFLASAPGSLPPQELRIVEEKIAIRRNFKVFEKEILKLLKNDEKFIRKKDHPNLIHLAREMNAQVSEWKKMDEIKKFYFEVNKKFNPEYVELFNKVK